MNNLLAVMNQLSINAKVFRTGGICGLMDIDVSRADCGHLHMISSGKLIFNHYSETGSKATRKKEILIEEPSLLFLPKPIRHSLFSENEGHDNLVCAHVEFISSNKQLIHHLFPEYIIIPFSTSAHIASVTQWLFDEAFKNSLAKQILLDKLAELLVIAMLKVEASNNPLVSNALNEMHDPQIAHLIDQLQAHPADNWTLESMAETALMSRAKLARCFKSLLGVTPAQYLTNSRITLAQHYLKQDKPASWVAHQTGYKDSSSFTRAFKQQIGKTPMQWKADYFSL